MTVDFIYNSLVTFFPDWANKDPFLLLSMLLPLVATFGFITVYALVVICLLYTSPSPRDRQKSRMPSSA